jgi:hypothetical protein
MDRWTIKMCEQTRIKAQWIRMNPGITIRISKAKIQSLYPTILTTNQISTMNLWSLK